jgi:outer membrane protein
LLIATSPDAPRKLSLAEAVDLALQVDPLVAEARIGEDRSKLAVLRSQLDRVSLKVDGQIQEIWADSNIGGPLQCTTASTSDPTQCSQAGGTLVGAYQQGLGLLNVAANLNVPLFSGFRVSSNVARAKKLEDSSLAGLRQQRKDTALTVARAYWNVRRIGLLIEVQRAALERMRDAEAVANGRVQAGLAPPIDRNRATARRLQQEATLADLSGQLHEVSEQLAVALGIPGEVVLTDLPDIPETAPPPVEALLDDARTARPELRIGKLQLEAQEQSVRMAKSNYYPQLGAFALLQYGNDPYITGVGSSDLLASTANPFTGTAFNVQLGLSLSMNFFDTFNTWTSVKDARYEEARLGEELRRIDRVVESDVRVAHAKLLHLYAQRAPLLQAREVAKDNLGIVENRYKNGDALIIEFLDTQIDLAGAERLLADLTAQLQLAWLELDASLGKVVGASS